MREDPSDRPGTGGILYNISMKIHQPLPIAAILTALAATASAGMTLSSPRASSPGLRRAPAAVPVLVGRQLFIPLQAVVGVEVPAPHLALEARVLLSYAVLENSGGDASAQAPPAVASARPISDADQADGGYRVEFRRFVNAVLERAMKEGGVFEWRGPRGVYFREAFMQRTTAEGLVRRIRVIDEERQGNFKRTVRVTEASHGGSERRAVTHETDGDGNGVQDNPQFMEEVAWWRAQLENGRKSETPADGAARGRRDLVSGMGRVYEAGFNAPFAGRTVPGLRP